MDLAVLDWKVVASPVMLFQTKPVVLRSDFCPLGMFGNVCGDIFGVIRGNAADIQWVDGWPGMLLNIAQGTGQPPDKELSCPKCQQCRG